MNAILTLAAAAAFALAALISPASAQDWTGPYLGGSLGHAATSARYCDDSPPGPANCAAAAAFLPTPSPEGAVLGLTGGHDWQDGAMVYGVAGDLLFGDLSDAVDSPFGCGTGCGLEVNAIAMLRGRAGYAMGDALIYGTAGVAFTHATPFQPTFESVNGTYVNLVVGAGLDYRLSQTTSVGVDVLHLVEGDRQIDFDAFCSDCAVTAFSATLARITLAFRF